MDMCKENTWKLFKNVEEEKHKPFALFALKDRIWKEI